MKRLILTSLTFCFFIVGCDGLVPEDKSTSSVKVQKDIKGDLLAQVGDWKIGTRDFTDKLDVLIKLYPDSKLNESDAKKEILKVIVDTEVLASEANARGLGKDQEVLEAVRYFKQNLLAQKILENIAQGINISDLEVKNFYDANKLSFTQPEERKIREIVVPTETEAKDILVRIYQGDDFASLARSYSTSDTRAQGGDLGWLKVDLETKFRDFWKEAFLRDKGSVSGYFRDPKGLYYILKIEDIKGGEAKPLVEVREDIRNYLTEQELLKKKEEIINERKPKLKAYTLNDNLLE
ncbi:MAG: peptidyl-prolyl cis-trans isomerase [Candidatus Omnitrophica bacterium]|nr:peptidyl-prolyl cis-trans isomerase [Candidatus Omnitrophota bacterium]